MDSKLVEEILDNWKLYGGIAAVVLFLAWNNRAKLGTLMTKAKAAVVGLVSGKKTTTSIALDKIDSDAIGVYAIHLVEIRDVLSQAGENEAIASIDSLVLPALFRARDTVNRVEPAEKLETVEVTTTTTTTPAVA